MSQHKLTDQYKSIRRRERALIGKVRLMPKREGFGPCSFYMDMSVADAFRRVCSQRNVTVGGMITEVCREWVARNSKWER